MSNRLCRSRRILAVQSKLDRLAEWRLIDLQFQSVALADRQHDLIRFLSGESEVAGIFPSAVMHRLQTLGRLIATTENEQIAQKNRRLDERVRLRCAERFVSKLEIEARRENTAQQLVDLIAAVFQRET